MAGRLFSMSTGMTIIHFALSIILFAEAIVLFIAKDLVAFNGLLILLFSVWMVATALHGWKYYQQYYFMYTYGGRGVFYLVVGLLVWGSNDSNYFSGVVSILFILFGIAGIGLGGFSVYEPPRPIIGPEDFIPLGEKKVSLSSQQDSLEDGLGSSSSSISSMPPTITSQQPTFSL
ncbi:hypothetical protein SAMD00019534_085570 [Acytostelium subglobosum LB1]|uniref:hypothetical protein n=1 Tax=Acytostelium subglobosum LB1 TaxID=1410327 RepID=UPI000644ACB4|nr:hypothetical protein SAMD00019534_085570 [Acytostelium subglobosum LB1]GAM25382.1 hypothetical protein SAMD00019534_085570 [Acytostelium subglobosum LB1]|eukprot:XP_012751902.1 hypothetical protein SAMD00019534_085570 [Acytostelium subglobosum LB1]